MSFQQFKLDRSILQTRGIFNKYIYEPDNGDAFLDVTQPGYFASSRFSGEEGWQNAIIEAQLSDGYFILGLDANGDATSVTPAPSPADVVQAVNDGLGYEEWQQGVQDAIFVKDWSDANNPVLSPYINGSGQWEFPADTLIITDTDSQSAEAAAAREITWSGSSLIIVPSAGPNKGIALAPGVGIGNSLFNAPDDSGLGSLIIYCSIFSADISRPMFDIGNIDAFSFYGLVCAGFTPGSINARETVFDSGVSGLIGIWQTYCVLGDNCDAFTWKNFDTNAPFLGINAGFDLTTTPLTGERVVTVESVDGTAGTGNAAILIDADDGVNVGNVRDSRNIDGDGIIMQAANDAAFNANPEKSIYFTFDVEDFARSRTTGSLDINGNGVATTNPGAGVYSIPDGVTSIGVNASRWSSPSSWVIQCDQLATDDYNITCAGNVGSGVGAFFGNNVSIQLIRNLGTDNELVGETVVAVDLGNIRSFTIVGNAIFSTGDTLTVQIANLDSGINNITVQDCEIITWIGNAS